MPAGAAESQSPILIPFNLMQGIEYRPAGPDIDLVTLIPLGFARPAPDFESYVQGSVLFKILLEKFFSRNFCARTSRS